MNDFIAYCGLDCETCEARLATVNNDDELRGKVARKWSELNGVKITPEMINCTGCRIDGVKTPYCESLCPIRQCALSKKIENCGKCGKMESCEKIGAIIKNNPSVLENFMTSVYESVPGFENEKYLLRFVKEEDAADLLKVYSDKNALPFFNSDNCHGDNFYYPTIERMNQAVDFWLKSYKSKWFVRWAVIDKASAEVVGTIELFHREADDYFNHCAVLRFDLRSDYENRDVIEEIAGLIEKDSYELFGTERLITKVPVYAVERMAAFEARGFVKSEEFLIGSMDGYAYKDYWEKRKCR